MKIGNIYDYSSDDQDTYCFILNIVYSKQGHIKYQDFCSFSRLKANHDHGNVWNDRSDIRHDSGGDLLDPFKYKNIIEILFAPNTEFKWKRFN
jgi:hypothetical protein